ncbi:hypothetical protein [Dokdonella sp.]|uniref:hypothetical protein n=1 Tax=Dokdonella sp. TaxID=2291710 RepID=UPI003C492C5D
MNKHVLLVAVATLVLAMPGHATIRENYPALEMAFVGNHAVEGVAGSSLRQPFALRLTDPDGRPLPGLTVYFQPNYVLNLNPGAVPPLSAHGSFDGELEVAVVTDENGIARSPDFQVGQFGHEPIAGLPDKTPENVAATQGGWGYAPFHVNIPHHGPVDPQAPVGGVASTALPVSSLAWLALLIAAIAMTAFVTLRRPKVRGKH